MKRRKDEAKNLKSQPPFPGSFLSRIPPTTLVGEETVGTSRHPGNPCPDRDRPWSVRTVGRSVCHHRRSNLGSQSPIHQMGIVHTDAE